MLYKYRDFSATGILYLEGAILRNEVWFSRASAFLDEADCCPRLIYPEDEDAKRHLFLDIAKRNKAAYDAAIDIVDEEGAFNWDEACALMTGNIRSKTLVSCFAKDPSMAEMWNDYADGGKGVCLRFSDPEGSPPFFSGAFPVNYVDGDVTFPLQAEYSVEERKAYFLTKAKKYDVEGEFRLLDFTNEVVVAGKSEKFDPRSLTGIIFGPDCPSEMQNLVEEWTKASQSKVEFLWSRQTCDGVEILANR